MVNSAIVQGSDGYARSAEQQEELCETKVIGQGC